MKLDDLKMELIKLEAEKEHTQAWLKKKDEEATQAINRTLEARIELQNVTKEIEKKKKELDPVRNELEKKEKQLEELKRSLLADRIVLNESIKDIQILKEGLLIKENSISQKELDVKRREETFERKLAEIKAI